MNLRLFPTLKNYNLRSLPGDIFSGIIIAAVSIPISMGYAQISGIPAIYGLYGSVFPILLFCFVFHLKAIYFWCRCRTCRHRRKCTCLSWYCR